MKPTMNDAPERIWYWFDKDVAAEIERIVDAACDEAIHKDFKESISGGRWMQTAMQFGSRKNQSTSTAHGKQSREDRDTIRWTNRKWSSE